MKILIIEDNPRKLQDTIDYVNDVCKEEVEIEIAVSVREGKLMLKETLYDRVIIDMQLPTTNNSSIDRFGGIAILNYLPMTDNANTRHIVNSSSSETREVLDNNNFPLVGLIVNSSMYNCTKQFDLFINGLKFIEEPIAGEMGVEIATALPVVESILDSNDNTRDREVASKAVFQGELVGKAEIEPTESIDYTSSDGE